MDKKIYRLPTVASVEEAAMVPAVPVDYYRNTPSSFRMAVTASAAYVRERGFAARVTAWESHPVARLRRRNGAIYRDSCVEWFVGFGGAADPRYLNLEVNALGCLYCKFGDAVQRESLIGRPFPHPTAAVTVEEDRWYADFFVPLETVAALYGRTAFSAGDRLIANFSKCGNDTPIPHFIMWNPIPTEPLEFHHPEYFGELILTD